MQKQVIVVAHNAASQMHLEVYRSIADCCQNELIGYDASQRPWTPEKWRETCYRTRAVVVDAESFGEQSLRGRIERKVYKMLDVQAEPTLLGITIPRYIRDIDAQAGEYLLFQGKWNYGIGQRRDTPIILSSFKEESTRVTQEILMAGFPQGHLYDWVFYREKDIEYNFKKTLEWLEKLQIKRRTAEEDREELIEA